MSDVLIFKKKIFKRFTSIKAELKNTAQNQELEHHRSWPKRIIFILFNILQFCFLGTRIQCRSRLLVAQLGPLLWNCSCQGDGAGHVRQVWEEEGETGGLVWEGFWKLWCVQYEKIRERSGESEGKLNIRCCRTELKSGWEQGRAKILWNLVIWRAKDQISSWNVELLCP